MKIALAQINTTVGALLGNSTRIMDAYTRAVSLGADLVIFPELALNGYPPRDLLDVPDFIRRTTVALDALAVQMTGPAAILGYVHARAEGSGKPLHNAAAVIDGGRIVSRHFKSLLPTYDVFDEARHFEPAHQLQVATVRGMRLGLHICEDAWATQQVWSAIGGTTQPRPEYARNPVEQLAGQGIDLLVNISASPYSHGKRAIKTRMFREMAARHGVPVVVVNQVGGNDNLIFDGWSNVWAPDGRVLLQAPDFDEALSVFDTEAPDEAAPGAAHSALTAQDDEETIYKALTLGIRDYLNKCGFQRALIGLSGGIDSALTAALAADALGPENVLGISMPSGFSSEHSRADARRLADLLGIEYRTVAVGPIYDAFLAQLSPLFAGTEFGVAEENLQARARGTLLMAVSNKFGHLVLSTGNKSEMAVGYCTLYGDMNGGLAVLADVLKTRVYALSRWINRDEERIPWSTIDKPPSAELRPGQFDSDSLPPYEVLDPIVAAYVEEHASAEEIVERGNDAALVRRITRMIDRAEYKRQQAAVCLKVSGKAFGSGRRMPIARGE